MNEKTEVLAALLIELSMRLNRKDFQGLQFKMNTKGSHLKNTIALRCNRIPLDEIEGIVHLVFSCVGKHNDVIERVSVNKAYAPGATGRKQYVRNARTMYITLRPPVSLFKSLWDSGLHACTAYAFTPVLLEKLEEECNEPSGNVR